MEKEIIIPRKRSKSIKFTIMMFFATIITTLPIILYFADLSFITSEVPLYVAVIGIVCAPICGLCTIAYFKEIFNEKPVLIINECGLQEEINYNSVGLIKWEDIKAINIIPYADNTYFICILLKDPAKYIKNTKLLNKLNKQKSTIKWGHIRFSSLYFKKEFNNIIEIMKYYYSKYNEDLNDSY